MTEIWTKEKQQALTPQEALAILKAGNRRFQENVRLCRDLKEQREKTLGGQSPFAFILGCIDSRVAPEVIFDLGIGEVFTARVAGNVLNEDLLGSVEFACHVVSTPLVVVLGHTACGAVQGACERFELGALTQLLKKIEPLVEMARQEGLKGEALVNRVAELHVQRVVASIPQKSPLLRKLLSEGRVEVVGAMYDLATGEVQFL